MAYYLLRRVLIGLFTLLLITFVVYGLIRSMPGTPITVAMEGAPQRQSREEIARREKYFGLDKPWYVAYFDWLGRVARGNLDVSIPQKAPVSSLILSRMGPTLLLSVSSLFLTYLLSIPLGLYSSVRAGKPDERTMSTILYMLYSFPAFVAALLLQMYLSVRFEWFPLFGMKSDDFDQLSTGGKVLDLLWHAALPITCYTYGSLAYYSRFIRSKDRKSVV